MIARIVDTVIVSLIVVVIVSLLVRLYVPWLPRGIARAAVISITCGSPPLSYSS